jgi:hypothetical protein
MKIFIKKNRGSVFLNILLVFAILLAVLTIYNKKTVCEKPLEYSIGTFDESFGITKEDFSKIVFEAEKIWEKGIGKDLFTYNPNALFTINLVFDKRQQETIAEKQFREKLNKENYSYDTLTNKYETLKASYNKRFEQYSSSVSLYEKKLKEYNNEVSYWNKHAGIPKEKYNDLEKKRLNLKNIEAQLKEESVYLKKLNDNMKSLVKQINSFAGDFNANIRDYNSKFGKARTFDQGEYTGDKINIYQFDKINDLRLVLAHEFGHALHLEHVENPLSIMYYLMDKQNLKDPTLSKEDLQALKIKCDL